MKSVKPGRGPSFIAGAVSVAMGIFGIIWTVLTGSLGKELFALFGIIFVGIAVCIAVYSFKNATTGHRYSSFDIVDDSEEADPLNKKFTQSKNRFCPYCGKAVEEDFEFCNSCGRRLP